MSDLNAEMFPVFAYISPGDHQAPGGTYSYVSADTEKELEALVMQGYCPSPGDAVSHAGKKEPFPGWSDWLEEHGFFAVAVEAANAGAPEQKKTSAEDESPDTGAAIDPPEKPEEDPKMPTREELEAEAKRLGVGFNRATKDEVLFERIEKMKSEVA